MLEDIPENIKDRETKFLDIIQNQPNRVKHDWISFTTPEATYVVSAQPVRIDSILINLSAASQITLAKNWDCSLLTAKVVDLIHQHADVIITPCPRMISSAKSAMILHSQNVDNKLKKYNTEGKLISTCGKDWVEVEKKPANGNATNYGWCINTSNADWNGIKTHPSSINGIRVIQPAGQVHSKQHLDYSQNARFISRIVIKETIYKASDIMFDSKFKHLFF
jgi:hypothetical protein